MDALDATTSPVAAVFGAAGLLCQLTWPLRRTRRAMLCTQLGIGCGYGTQYALLGAWSGAAVCALGALQTLITLLSIRRPRIRSVGIAILPGLGVVGLVTWAGPHSGLALASCALVMVARLQPTPVRLRVLMLAAAPFGLAYDLVTGALPSLAGASLALVIGAAALWRELRRGPHPAAARARRGLPSRAHGARPFPLRIRPLHVPQ